MRNITRLTGLAVFFLIVLRMAIGWQFLYEGLWKIRTLQTDRPWTAAGYLKNAQGPFRSHFRDLAGDPNELNWLDYDHVVAQWDDWHRRFLAAYPDLDDRQTQQLDEMLNGRDEYAAVLETLPPTVEFRGELGQSIRFDAGRKRLIIDGERHLLPQERARLLEMVSVEEVSPHKFSGDNEVEVKFAEALDKAYLRASRLSFKDRLAALLRGDPERVGPTYEAPGDDGETIVEKRIGEIELYKKMLDRYEQQRAKAEQTFQHEHLARKWEEIQALRARLVGPVKALHRELMAEAQRMLSVEQIAQGTVEQPMTQIRRIDYMTIGGLTVLGAMLLFGLFSRLAAFGAAVLLTSFYLAMPPWPGVVGFQELPGPEHSYLVDKNLIEVFALLALASLPTGKWFGIDRLITWIFRRPKNAEHGEPA